MRPGQRSDLLAQWKGIARYLAVSTRTAQRWADRLGLPVYRPSGGRVYASAREVDAWLRATIADNSGHPTPAA